MENTQSPFFKSALTHGIIFGVILIIPSLLMWMFNFMPVGIAKGIIIFFVTIAVYFFALYWFTKNYRNTFLNGYISYGKAFSYALTVVIITSLINAIYTYFFYQFIDPGYSEKVINATINVTEEYMSSKGIPDATISAAIDKIRDKGIPTSMNLAVRGIISGTIIGAICALITSAIVKKESNPIKD